MSDLNPDDRTDHHHPDDARERDLSSVTETEPKAANGDGRLQAEIDRLAALPELDYDLIDEATLAAKAKELGLKNAAALDRAVGRVRKAAEAEAKAKKKAHPTGDALRAEIDALGERPEDDYLQHRFEHADRLALPVPTLTKRVKQARLNAEARARGEAEAAEEARLRAEIERLNTDEGVPPEVLDALRRRLDDPPSPETETPEEVGPRPDPDLQGKKRSVNVLLLVRRINNDAAWQDVIQLNELADDIEVRDPFPPTKGSPAGAFRPLRDPIDALEAMLWFQTNGIPKTSKSLVYDAITIIAHRHAYHPVRQYLDALHWDGTERVGTLFQNYFKAELPDDPTERDRSVAYLEHISRCFLVSAVARIHRPGCKADHMPVLVGPQGSNKSKAIRALCKDDAWFTDDLSPDLIERDTKDSLNGKWIIELAEMPHVRKEVERVKAFVSRPTDRFRRAYDRLTNDWPRQCVFIGSSNDLEFIDPTGNRRFWPFWIAGLIDVDAIIRDRDQLWAEAVALYLEGVPWWLPPKLELIAADQQASYVETDIWDNLLTKWIENNQGAMPFDLPTIMAGALDYTDARRIPKLDQMRAASCLKRLGYRRGDPKRTPAGRIRFWSPR